MKKILLSLLALTLSLGSARADEGMWLLAMMEQQHLADSLKKAGLEISPNELYSESMPSLKDVVGIFGNGCTGEIVSRDGLIFTNNHCGFDFVHSMSTMEHNYLQDGFYAKSRAEELHTPGLDFVFVRAIKDVTQIVNDSLSSLNEYDRQSQQALAPLAKKLLAQSEFAAKKGMRARLVPFYDGNRFYIFYEQVYTDVRLVVNIPQNFAQFGENQDNWMWPRHNPDVAVFRVYADANGEPADYNTENVPLRCEKYLPISMSGIKQGDFAMVMGFPGTTTRYLTAGQIEGRVRDLNAPINTMGNVVLDHLKQLMDNDPELNLSLASDYFMMGNTVKNFGGMNEAVRKIKLVERTRLKELDFKKWAQAQGKPEYAGAITVLDELVKLQADTLHDLYLASFGMRQLEMKTDLPMVTDYVENFKKYKKEKKADEMRATILSNTTFLTPAQRERNRALMKKVFRTYLAEKKLDLSLCGITSPAESDLFVEAMFVSSIFADSTRLDAFLKKPDAKKFALDPFVYFRGSMPNYIMELTKNLGEYSEVETLLRKTYTGAQCERLGWSKAPDANFTLRMTYGKVCDLNPRDAVHYDYETVIDGMFEKENPADPDYVVNEKVRALYLAQDFGRYARPDGKLPACFITDNDITGGNSGSPVMNARGELIGVAFDGNIESLSSDLEFNPELQRCICVDIRYVLWCIDKLAGSTYLFDELDLR